MAVLQGTFKSVSAFAPIANPMDCPWGHKAFGGYLGQDRESWKEYDATVLMRERGPFPFKILVDQGTGDKFLAGETGVAERADDDDVALRCPLGRRSPPVLRRWLHDVYGVMPLLWMMVPTEQLKPEAFQKACQEKGQALTLRMQGERQAFRPLSWLRRESVGLVRRVVLTCTRMLLIMCWPPVANRWVRPLVLLHLELHRRPRQLPRRRAAGRRLNDNGPKPSNARSDDTGPVWLICDARVGQPGSDAVNTLLAENRLRRRCHRGRGSALVRASGRSKSTLQTKKRTDTILLAPQGRARPWACLSSAHGPWLPNNIRRTSS